MNPELIILSETTSGSRLHRTYLDNSGHDKIVVFAYKQEDLILGTHPLTFKKGDTVYYELSRFIQLLIRGDMGCHEVLWAPPEHTHQLHGMFEMFKNRKRDFIASTTLKTWLMNSEYLFNRAERLGSIKILGKGIEDFCDIMYYSYTNGLHIEPLIKTVLRGTFDPNSQMVKMAFLFTNYGLLRVGNTDMYQIWEDYRANSAESKVLGFFDDNQIIESLDLVGNLKSNYNRFSFKGVLKYNKRAHLKYEAFKEELRKSVIVKGYATKSMLHSFRTIFIVDHYMTYNRISTEAPNITYLYTIRKGDHTLADLKLKYFKELRDLQERLERVTDPEQLNYKVISNLEKKLRNNIEENSMALVG